MRRWLVIGGPVGASPAAADVDVDVGLGLGATTTTASGQAAFAITEPEPNAALALTVSGRIGSQVDLGGRAVAAVGRLSTGFVGPAIRWRLHPDAWLGAGVGLAGAVIKYPDFEMSPAAARGYGLDLRAGIVVRQAVSISLEATPALLKQPFQQGNTVVTSFVVLLDIE